MVRPPFVAAPRDRHLASWSPFIVVAVWLSGLGYALWHLALASAQPPIYDGMAYFLKGKNFWDALFERFLFNPFRIHPGARPPGTILMSFPLGYDADVHAFHFRSVFLPILVTALSAWLLVRNSLEGRGSAIVAVGLTLAVSSLPMFYSLEPNPNLLHHSVWGHVDALLASIAALATAGFIMSIRTRSLKWLLLGASASAFSLFVKPAGMMVMALTGLVWLALSLSQFILARDDDAARRSCWRHIRRGLALLVPLYAFTLALSIVGGYLTREEIEYFRTGLSVLSSLRTSWTLREVDGILNTTIGYPFAVLCVLGLVGSARFAIEEPGRRALSDASVIGSLCAIAFLVLGLGWWMVTTSGTMVRYILPIVLMSCVALLPGIGMTALRSPLAVRIIMVVVAFAMSANLAALLVAGTPSLSWQRASGVNLTAGRSNEEAKAAKGFLDSGTFGSRPTIVYIFGGQASITTFESVVNFAAVTDKGAPRVQFLRPIDWVRTSAYRLNELLSADYLLFSPLRDYSPPPNIDNHYLEELAMRTWASFLSAADGVRTEVSLPELVLLKVIDRSALHRSADAFVRKYGWPQDFVDANSLLWLDSRMLGEEKQKSHLLLDNRVFGNEIEILAITSRRDGSDKATVIDVWWKPVDEDATGDGTLEFELRSASDKILLAGTIPLPMRSAPDPGKPIRHDAAFFRLPRPPDARFVLVSVKRDGIVLPARR